MPPSQQVTDYTRESIPPAPGNGATHHETKHARFLRIGTSRVQRALQAIDLVGKLASSKNEYDEREAHQIVAALNEHVQDVARLLAHEKPQKKDFAFE